MPYSEMLRRVALARIDVSEERIASIIRATGVGELGTLAVTSNRSTLVTAKVVPTSSILVALMTEATRSFDASVLARATRRNTPKDGILQQLD
jgi:hypothetical protein